MESLKASIESKAGRRRQVLYQDFFVDLCQIHQETDIFDEKNEKVLRSFFESYYPGSTFTLEYRTYDDDDEKAGRKNIYIEWVNPHLYFDQKLDSNRLANRMMEMFFSPFDVTFDSSEYSNMILGMKVVIIVDDSGKTDKAKLQGRKITLEEVKIFERWASNENLTGIDPPDVVNDYLIDFWRKN